MTGALAIYRKVIRCRQWGIYEGSWQQQLQRVLVSSSSSGRGWAVACRPGMGLDEKALEVVSTWRCEPAMAMDGRLPSRFEITFRLYRKDLLTGTYLGM